MDLRTESWGKYKYNISIALHSHTLYINFEHPPALQIE